MSKKHEETLFEIPMETEDIDVSDEITLRMPATSGVPQQSGQANSAGTAPNLKDFMLSGELPPLLAVDIGPGENPRPNTIVQKEIIKPEIKPDTTIPPVAETKIEPIIPAATTEKTTDPVTTTDSKGQGQQGGKGAEEENLSPMYLHAAALHQEGVLPNLDLKEIAELKGPELIQKLIEASREEVKNQAETLNEAYKNQFNDPQKQVLEMIGQGIPFDDAANIVYNQQRYDSITDAQLKESPEIQEKVYREFLHVKGHKPEFIEKSVKNAKDLETLEVDSIGAIVELRQAAKDDEVTSIEYAKTQKIEREAKNLEVLNKIKSEVTATKQIFDGVALKPEDQAKILEYMTVPAAEINRGGKIVPISKKDEIRMKNPIEFEKRLAYFIHLGLFNEKPTIPELVASGETKAVNKLAEVLSGGKAPRGGAPVISKKDQNSAAGRNDQDLPIVLPGQIASVRHNE